MEIAPVQTFYLGGCLSESKRILRANYTNFIALSILFLPLSLCLIINPIFTLSGSFFTSDHFHKFIINPSVVPHLFYILIVYILALCAIYTITYTTYHGFSGKPIKFIAALKSLSFSFFPLVSTAFVALINLVVISLTFILFVGVIVMLGQNLGLLIDYDSIHFMEFSVVVGGTLIAILVYFLLNWSLAIVVIVAESKWGFEALIRSSYLMEGMKLASLSVLVYFGVFVGFSVWFYSGSRHNFGSSIYALVPMTLGSILVTWFLLWYTTANTFMYMYCKAFNGEKTIDSTAGGSAQTYIKMHSDDEKVPHVVTDVEALTIKVST